MCVAIRLRALAAGPLLALLIAVLGAAAAPALGQTAAPPEDSSPKIRLLLDLLADPEVKTWAERRREAAPPAPPAEIQAEGPAGGPLALLVDRIRRHVASLAEAAPHLPAQFAAAGEKLGREVDRTGLIKVVALVAAFVALGYGAERLFWALSKGWRAWITALPLDTVGARLRAMGMRLVFGTSWVAAFAAGSIGAFLPFAWPPLLREIVLAYLAAFLALRLAIVLLRFLLAPTAPRFRIVPLTDAAARHWHVRLAAVVGWFSFMLATSAAFEAVGLSDGARRLVLSSLGLGNLLLGFEAVWRRPRDPFGPASEAAPDAPALSRTAVSWLFTGWFVLQWSLRLVDAMPLLWLVMIGVALPLAVLLAQRAVNHVLRPPGDAAASAAPGLAAICLERGIRAALIVGAVLVLAQGWGIDFGELSARDTLTVRLMRGALSAAVIFLVADFLWRLVQAAIDLKLAEIRAAGRGDGEEAHRRARLGTLLPIGRTVALAVLGAMAVLMALSALGVEIGPLIAGAGVVGVAIGFGSQTLVRDVISGVFYLLDDAFRVGEYIQSGAHKGTVESFTLRSVKLRHHRGTLTTVPFGALGAVQNASRDWVIDKLTIGITYDSDIEKAKKLVKQVGKELAAVPEYAPHILEPLKMQGVDKFGDFSIDIRLKMKTRPGEQFVIRRRALAMIKKAFDENGVKFAFPTVQVAGGGGDGDATAAAAGRAIAALAAEPKPA